MVQDAVLWNGNLSQIQFLFTLFSSSLERIKDLQSLSDKKNVGVNIQPPVQVESLACADKCS